MPTSHIPQGSIAPRETRRGAYGGTAVIRQSAGICKTATVCRGTGRERALGGHHAVDFGDDLTQVERLRQHPRVARRLLARLQCNGGETGDEHDPDLGLGRGGPAGELAASGSLGVASAVVALHTLMMLAVTVAVAVGVYEWVGLGVLRRGWVNLDLVWTAALIAAAVLLVLL